jgi:hypothetical protein
MANPDFTVMKRFQRHESALRSLIGDGGGGGDDGGMEARLSAPEAAHLETRDRLTRIETRLDAVATKRDVASLGGDLPISCVQFIARAQPSLTS